MFKKEVAKFVKIGVSILYMIPLPVDGTLLRVKVRAKFVTDFFSLHAEVPGLHTKWDHPWYPVASVPRICFAELFVIRGVGIPSMVPKEVV